MTINSYILAIDPGNEQSAYCVIKAEDCSIAECGILENNEMLEKLSEILEDSMNVYVAIEMIASYGMAVGKEVFETCVWIGRFIQQSDEFFIEANLVYRKDVKINLCNSMRAKDANVIQALKDRFGGKGTKAKPGWFFGFKDDIWSAYAVGVTYLDMKGKTND